MAKWLGSRHRVAGWGSERSGRGSGRRLGSHLFVRFGQILGEDLDLVLHGLDDLFHPGGGPLLEDSLYPSSSGDHFFHGAAAEFLDFRHQWAIESAEKSVNRVPLCRFIIAGMQAFGEFLGLSRKLNYFF